VKQALGWVLISLGLVAFGIYLVGLIDPVGTQQADDGDPFGVPGPWYFWIIGMVASAFSMVLGAWLVKSKPTKQAPLS
jgi:hypothetical protein